MTSDAERAPVLQWLGVFLAPAVFFSHLEIGYVLLPWACTTRQELWVHLVAILAVLLAAAGVVAAWLARARSASPEPDDGAGVVPRTRFLGDVGLGISGLLTLIPLMQAVGGFLISSCQ
jgi:hypothetical protein